MSQVLRIVTLAIVAWFVLARLGNWLWPLPWLVTTVAIINSWTVWMVRSRRNTVARLCRWKSIARYVRTICYLIGDEVPTESSSQQSSRRLLLHSRRDFDVAASRAKQIVRGHNEAIDGVFDRIHENHRLRTSRKRGSWKGPLASLMLVGCDGVGKLYLTRVISKLLFKNGGVDVFDCNRLSLHELVGTEEEPGDLLESVGRQPQTILCFEHVDAASPELQDLLIRILTTKGLDLHGLNGASFENSIMVFTTNRSCSALRELDAAHLGLGVWHQRAVDAICDETTIDQRLLGSLTDLFYCASPNDHTKAEVISILMQNECKAHGIRLLQVAPAILATQVFQFNEIDGFGPAPQRVKKLLRQPLIAATGKKHRSLSLHVRA